MTAESGDRAQDELDQLQAQIDDARGRLAAASHELRAPLNAVAGFAELLLTRGNQLDPEQRRRSLEAIRRNAERAARLCEMLDRSPGTDPGARQIAVGPLLRAAIADIGAAEVAIESPAGLTVLASPDRLTEILVNLVDNARKYGSEPIMISAEPVGERTRIAVTDQGEGVAEDFAADMFDMFTRAPNVVGTRPGTGVGLAVCRRLAEEMDGTLEHETPTAGGARFVLDLPRGTASPAPGVSVGPSEREINDRDATTDADDANGTDNRGGAADALSGPPPSDAPLVGATPAESVASFPHSASGAADGDPAPPRGDEEWAREDTMAELDVPEPSVGGELIDLHSRERTPSAPPRANGTEVELEFDAFLDDVFADDAPADIPPAHIPANHDDDRAGASDERAGARARQRSAAPASGNHPGYNALRRDLMAAIESHPAGVDSRPQMNHLEVEQDGLTAFAHASLTIADRQVDGHANAAATFHAALRAVARATLDAVEEVVGDRARFEVERIEVDESTAPGTVTVLLSLVTHTSEETLAGVALIESDHHTATMKATLGALNRRIATLLQ